MLVIQWARTFKGITWWSYRRRRFKVLGEFL
jgi:hypothetical protein